MMDVLFFYRERGHTDIYTYHSRRPETPDDSGYFFAT